MGGKGGYGEWRGGSGSVSKQGLGLGDGLGGRRVGRVGGAAAAEQEASRAGRGGLGQVGRALTRGCGPGNCGC